jgi:hypothetical protein
MEPFTEMDFYSAIKPLYYVSKATGVGQFSFHKSRYFNGKILKAIDLRPSGIFWTLFVLLIHISGLVSVTVWNSIYDYMNYSAIVVITDASSILLLYGSSFSCLIIVGIIHRKDIIQILKKIYLLDTILLQNFRERNYKNIHSYLTVELSVCVVILFLAYCYHVSSWAGGIAIIPFASKDLAHFTGTVVLIQYIDIVLLIWNRFKKLNEKILLQFDNTESNINRRIYQNVFSRSRRIAFTVDSETLLSRKQKCKESYCKLSAMGLQHSGNQRTTKEVIREFRVIHSELTDICEIVNSTYGLPLLVLFTYYFLSLLSSFYYVMQKIVSMNETSETDLGSIRGMISTSFWALVFLMKVVITTVVCTEASAAATSTGRIIQKLLLQDLSQDVTRELKLFCLQLLGNKTELFTSFKFFEINLTFLYSFLGGTAMYIVVLIQLK